MNYFCTLFDSFYLNRGLVMYQSLKEHCPEFHLYIFPFDDAALKILQQLKLENVTLVSLKEFENEALLAVKPGRTKGEYCWTCTSSTIDYCLKTFSLPHCTYIDADLCFYSDPTVLLDETKDKSVLITEHRYTPKYDQSADCGVYCVQFITFKNTSSGLQALHWWRDRCLEWCYARFEDGKFGDQKYLDDWTTRFSDIHVLEHLGGGVAPWNVQQYDLSLHQNAWLVTEKETGKQYPLVFYHFHYVKFFNDGTVNYSDIYNLGFKAVLDLYKKYLKKIQSVNELLAGEFEFVAPLTQKPKRSALYRMAKKVYNKYQKIYGLYNNLEIKDLVKD